MSETDFTETPEGDLARNGEALRQAIAERLALLGASGGAAEELAGELLGRIERIAFRERATAAEAASAPEAGPARAAHERPVVIIGGRGGMGRQLEREFVACGLAVRILGRRDWDRAAEILKGAGTVIVSVPIDVTEAVIGRLAGLLPADALLCDVTSVKAGPVAAMLAAHPGPVAGLHPMYGPDVEGFAGQVVVHTPGRDPEAARPLLDLIRARGARVVECSAEDHDRAMSIIQALRHFTTYAYGVFLEEVHPDLATVLALSSPIYRLELEMVGRLFAQDPRLYADIILANPRNARLIRRYVESLAPELEMIEAGDRDEFVRRFGRVREWFGDLAPAFMAESGRMLNLIQAERARRK